MNETNDSVPLPDLKGFRPEDPIPSDAGLFGLSTSIEESLVHILPVPFEVTASYGRGTSQAPEAIRKASHQLDLFDLDTGRPYERGIFVVPASERIRELNAMGIDAVEKIATRPDAPPSKSGELREKIDHACAEMNAWVEGKARESLALGRLVGVLGGDHSTPFGSIAAHADKYPGLGILTIDAHHDLRRAYEDFTWSHASIMHNVLDRLSGVDRLVQVGVRDYAKSERTAVETSNDRVICHYDRAVARALEEGATFADLARAIVDDLPRNVYVSFDIDGLSPHLCPNTGTPVPGGLEFNQAVRLIEEIVTSGRRIIGFDLVEVSPGEEGEWDASVGARILYKLIGWALRSRP